MPGSRSLSWLTPYSCTLEPGTFPKKTVHNKLTLLKALSNLDLRDFISFIIIPKNSKLTFQIGSTSEQQSKKALTPGRRLQFTVQNVHQGTLVLTEFLAHRENKNGRKETFDLSKKFESAVQRCSKDNPNEQILDNLETEICANRDYFIRENFTNLTK